MRIRLRQLLIMESCKFGYLTQTNQRQEVSRLMHREVVTRRSHVYPNADTAGRVKDG
jgi:hypothetical protein